MVDILSATGGTESMARTSALIAASGSTWRVSGEVEEALALVGQMPGGAVHSAAQSPAWLRAWFAATGAPARFLILEDAAGPRLILPLEILTIRGFRTARYPGGSHANGNAPLLSGEAPQIGASALDPGFRALRAATPGLCAVMLERQAERVCGAVNPLRFPTSTQSPNVALSLSLDGGFDAVLARHNGKRRRKKFRTANRKLEEFGGAQPVRAATRAEAKVMLDAFFAMKASRFAKAGIHNVFDEPGVNEFLRTLFGDSIEARDGRFELNGLRIGDRFVAVNGLSVTGRTLTAEFGSIDDAFDFASPGELHYFLCIEDACRRGFTHFDFSVGDEQYKRSWCEIETWHFDTIVPLSPIGQALAAALGVRSAIVRRVKSDERIWPFVKRMRARLRGGAAPEKMSDED